MNDPRHQLTPEIQRAICGIVCGGSFPEVAAGAAGIPPQVFQRWMKWGKAARPVPLYRDFYEAVCQAQAQARAFAESQALRRAPVSWLKFGPGRETARMPGWTSPAKPTQTRRGQGGMSSAFWQEIAPLLLTTLTPFPEARAALSDMLEQLELKGQAEPEATSESPKEVHGHPGPPGPMPDRKRMQDATIGIAVAAVDLQPEQRERTEAPLMTALSGAVPLAAVAEMEPIAATVTEARSSPVEMLPEALADAVHEPARNLQPGSLGPETKAQRNRSQPAANLQRNDNKSADSGHLMESAPVLKPQRKAQSAWERFKEIPWAVAGSG